jgi:hypothetical protein
MRGITLNLKKLQYIRKKKSYYKLFKVYRAWKSKVATGKKERMAVYNRNIKGVITAFYALSQYTNESKQIQE